MFHPLRIALPWLAGAAALSLAGVMLGARAGLGLIVLPAAVLFALAAAATSLHFNVPLWRLASSGLAGHIEKSTAQGNALLMALTYAWGAAALLAAYGLAGLSWRHAWQYGTGMALIAALLGLYARGLRRRGGWLDNAQTLRAGVALTVLQGAAALGGLAFLVTAGKLASVKGDWAANHVFLGGGAAIIALSAVAAATHVKVMRQTIS